MEYKDNFNPASMEDDELINNYRALSEHADKIAAEFNALPENERKNGSINAVNKLCILEALYRSLIPINNELQRRVYSNPEFYMGKLNIN